MMDFLRETFLEAQTNNRVVLRNLSDRLQVSAPAVSRMAQRLIRKGLLKRDGACGLILSDTGKRIALRALRKQRIFEVFLVRQLGYRWDEVFLAAKSTYVHLDDDLIERMALKLDNPDRCPHGDPIPTREGNIEFNPETRLTELENNKSGVIGRVDSHDPELLQYLGLLGLQPGAPITMIGRAPFGGPIRIKTVNQNSTFTDEHIIGTELASKVWVENVA